MGNAFRRIALAQGLLPSTELPEPPSSWTDEALNALLQIDETATSVPATLADFAERQAGLRASG